jgi:Helix-turn-helix domain
LRLAGDEADLALPRADARRNLLAVARVIGWSADRRSGRSRPTLARIVKVSGLSLRTVQRWCRWLEQRGLLTVLEPGVTAQYRPGRIIQRKSNV